MVHIREYANADNDKSYPANKGVGFAKVRWATFHSKLEEIDRNVDLLKADQHVEYRQHIVGKYYVTISLTLCLGMMYSRVRCAWVWCVVEYVMPRYRVLLYCILDIYKAPLAAMTIMYSRVRFA